MANHRRTIIARVNTPDKLTRADEAQLIGRCLSNRDTAAFGELVRRHQSAVRSFLRRLCKEPALADDLAQECFVRAWDKLHTFNASGSLAGWLMQVAYRQFLQWARQHKRQSEILEQFGQQTLLSGTAITQDCQDAPDLARLLAVLSEPQRRVMILSYGYGMTHIEIHAITGLAVGTIKSHIRRSKLKIRNTFNLQEVANG